MAILDDLIADLPEDSPVRSGLVGVHWTAVCSRYCGISATLISGPSHGHPPYGPIRRLHGQSARELAQRAHSANVPEASIGVAAINSLLEVDGSLAVEVNASDVLARHGWQKKVAVVGRFPFIQRLRQNIRQLWVIEQHPATDEYPAESAADLLPQADVIALTGSTLINHTLDSLLALCNPGATVIVWGPSTPLSPVLFDHGVHILCGTRVRDEVSILRAISRGASIRQIEGVQRLALIRERKFW